MDGPGRGVRPLPKLHAIIQETSQNAQAVEDKMLAYRRSGARVEALFMGVPKAMSDQGIVSRYFEQLADRGQGRLTVQSNADESYRGILDLADRVDDSALASRSTAAPRGRGGRCTRPGTAAHCPPQGGR
ncbi:zeta toxin family protein [Streptomyces sp. XY413]|uniref:zeta toxin family protein n=1 Tax=Streptomyces sp. XY413 TaxID=1519479 RepID=UPI002277BF45|nr:zeta toxin family protein [Streptomyces sp. XY413]